MKCKHNPLLIVPGRKSKHCSEIFECPCPRYSGKCDRLVKAKNTTSCYICNLDGHVCRKVYPFKCENGIVDGLTLREHQIITRI